MLFLDVTKKRRKKVLLRVPIKKMDSYDRTYDFVMTYVGNRTINMTLVMLFLIGNQKIYVHPRSTFKKPGPESFNKL